MGFKILILISIEFETWFQLSDGEKYLDVGFTNLVKFGEMRSTVNTHIKVTK